MKILKEAGKRGRVVLLTSEAELARILTRIVEKGLSLNQLANILGIPKSTLWDYKDLHRWQTVRDRKRNR